MKTNLDGLWQALEEDARRAPGLGLVKRMIAPDASVVMFIGVRQPSLNRLFIIELERSFLPSRDQIPESRGFNVSAGQAGDGSVEHAALILTALDPDFNQVFTAMVQDISENIEAAPDQKLAVPLLLSRLSHWQRFFEKTAFSGLGEEAQRGLYGELYFLSRHLLGIRPVAIAISAWTGPDHRQHDFQFGEVAVEVKVSISKQHQKFFVASEQQLDDSQVGALFLFHLSLALVENSPQHLPALVNELRNKIGSDPGRTRFEEVLLTSGYLDAHAWRYERTGYAIRDESLFRIHSDFPRLTEEDLPSGVGDLSYSVSVSECRRFSIRLSELSTCLGPEDHE